MEEITKVQWFPGHMTKTKRKMQESISLVDAVLEIIDARIPVSSRNPELNGMIGNKPRLILMNKCDMADDAQTKKWVRRLQSEKEIALPVDCKSGKGLGQVLPAVRELLKEKIAGWEQKGMSGRPIKLMIVGVPNVGKSSFINKMISGGRAKVEDRPGVTRGSQWFSMGKGYELLDTPGVLWPKFEDPLVGEHLAFTGAVRDEVVDIEQLAARLAQLLAEEYPQLLCQRYKLKELPETEGLAVVRLIGKKRGMLISGGEVDTERASITILDEFRGGKIGRITIEQVKEG